jgi:hypothetical protein
LIPELKQEPSNQIAISGARRRMRSTAPWMLEVVESAIPS